MQTFDTYDDLLAGLGKLEAGLKQVKRELEARKSASIPEERTPVTYRRMNEDDQRELSRLQMRLNAASSEYGPLARALGGSVAWGSFEPLRPALCALFKTLGFDVVGRARLLAEEQAAFQTKFIDIERARMRVEPMRSEEFEELASDWNRRRRQKQRDVWEAVEKLPGVSARLSRVQSLIDAVRTRAASVKGMRFTPGYAASVRLLEDLAHDNRFDEAFRLLDSIPVRVRPSEENRREFREMADSIVGLWRDSGLYNVDRNPSVAEGVVHAVRSAQVCGDPVGAFDDVREVLSVPGLLRHDIHAALYWLGSAAEHAILERVPGIANEDFFNAGLVAEIENVSETTGQKLFRALGYTVGFPFEIAMWETDMREDEADTGADMCIIVYIRLENNLTAIRGALLQGKLAAGVTANVYRESSRLGHNHQLISLSSGNAHGYYSFYHDPPDTLGVSVVSASCVRSTIEGRSPKKKKLWQYREAACKVQTDHDATDFASFLAFTLMDPRHGFTSIEDALVNMGTARTGYEKEQGEDVIDKLASRLAVVSVGGAIPAIEMKILAKYGFKETGKHKRLTPPSYWGG